MTGKGTAAAAGGGVAGLALLLIESVRALGQARFDTLATILLYLGLGLLALAGILAIVTIFRADDSGEPMPPIAEPS